MLTKPSVTARLPTTAARSCACWGDRRASVARSVVKPWIGRAGVSRATTMVALGVITRPGPPPGIS